MPDQQGYALLRSFPELDVAGVLPCSNLERLKGDWFCWMGHPQKDNDQSNLWPFHDDSPLEFWNLFPNFISDKGTLIYIYIYVYVYVYMSMYNIYIHMISRVYKFVGKPANKLAGSLAADYDGGLCV